MALITTIADVHKNRPLKPRYAKTQATAQAVRKSETGADGTTAETTELQPGMVLSRKSDGTVFVCKGSTEPAGLCGTFEKELDLQTGGKDVAMWVLGSDAIFALDNYNAAVASALTTAKTTLDAGGEVLLEAGSDGLLTIAASDSQKTPVCRLIGIEGTTLLIAGCL